MADNNSISDKPEAPAEPPAETKDQLAEAETPEDNQPKPAKGESKFKQKLQQFKHWYRSHLLLSIPLTILAIILLIIIIPFLRYTVFGLFLEKNFAIQVLDSETKAPVSGATVTIDTTSAQTDGTGKATVKSKPGHQEAKISKKYYKDGELKVTVPVLNQKNTPQATIMATGRQVKINVLNTISKKAVNQVNIKVADITAQTDSSGNATIVLPPGVPEQKATLSANGYNDTAVTIKVSDTAVAENHFTLTAAGKVYFLSKRTGKIDVMKSNLDGSDQKVVLAGTGTESDTDTILLASRDWKYLALKSKRDNNPAKLYYIDTSVDKLNTLDEGNADFILVGWSGDTFVYQVNRNGYSAWQPNAQALKSFNATNGKLTLLNQTSAVGDSNTNASESFTYSGAYILGSTVVFSKNWIHGSYVIPDNPVIGKAAGIYSVSVDGSGLKTLKSFTYNNPSDYYYISGILYEPNEIYYSVNDGYGTVKYFKYTNGNLTEDASIADSYAKFQSSPYPTYLLSPSGKQTYWVESRDGKSSFLLGDANGDGSKEIAKLDSKFLNYGYYTDDYLLVSKDSDEIYVMPSAGVKTESELIKITDYHKPAYNFYGYGGGYGGL